MKTPIWLLSGFLGGENHWGEFPDALAHFSGIIPEIIPWQRYCEGANSLDEAANFLAQFAYSTGVRPILVGYSMGGRLALQTALSAPGAFSAAVALSAHPGFQLQSEKEARITEDRDWKNLMLEDFSAFWKKWNAREALRDTSTPPKPQLSEEEKRIWAHHLIKLSTGSQDFFPTLMQQGLKIPVLSVTGQNDKKFSDFQNLYAPFVKTHILNAAGHRLPLEKPKELAAVVADFLKDSRDQL